MGCTGSGELRNNGNSVQSDVDINSPAISLADYLRQVSGVQVQGSGSNTSVFVRGAAGSFQGDNRALFVVDGVRVGRNYSMVANSVQVNDIESIRVLKGSEASAMYGIEGNKGVIVIRTKR